jgi:hypothetical protein
MGMKEVNRLWFWEDRKDRKLREQGCLIPSRKLCCKEEKNG